MLAPPHHPPTMADEMSKKIEHLLTMVSSNQQVLLQQQAASQLLQDQVKSLSQELTEVKSKVEENLDGCSKKDQKRLTVPPALSVGYIPLIV